MNAKRKAWKSLFQLQSIVAVIPRHQTAVEEVGSGSLEIMEDIMVW